MGMTNTRRAVTATLLPKSTDNISEPCIVKIDRMVYDRGEFKGAWTTDSVYFPARRLIIR
jgi:hypothetical protein